MKSHNLTTRWLSITVLKVSFTDPVSLLVISYKSPCMEKLTLVQSPVHFFLFIKINKPGNTFTLLFVACFKDMKVTLSFEWIVLLWIIFFYAEDFIHFSYNFIPSQLVTLLVDITRLTTETTKSIT